jgi:hypothetical protein
MKKSELRQLIREEVKSISIGKNEPMTELDINKTLKHIEASQRLIKHMVEGLRNKLDENISKKKILEYLESIDSVADSIYQD